MVEKDAKEDDGDGKKGTYTIREVLDRCLNCKTKEDADKVFKHYKEKMGQYTEQNLGYMFGYLSQKEMNRMYKLFDTCFHPVFGAEFGRGKEVTTDEAFKAGLEIGKKTKGE